MHYRGCVSMTPRILHVIVNRMIVSRNGLEGRGVRIGKWRLGARKISPTRRSSNVRADTMVKLLGSKVCAVSGMSVVKFMLSSFPSLLFEGWPFIEDSVDARLFFGRLMAATAAAAPRITLRRDKQLDPALESGDILDSTSFVCVGMFIVISFVVRLGFQEPQRFGPVTADRRLSGLLSNPNCRQSEMVCKYPTQLLHSGLFDPRGTIDTA